MQHKKYLDLASIPFLQIPWDAVFYGNSITEQWMGTKEIGTVKAPEFQEVFESHFSNSLALGTSGDLSTELLYHIQNGALPDSLETKAVVLLTGTNDLGRSGCSKESTYKGIRNVIDYIRQRKPKTYILGHGLLPRGDVYDRCEVDYSLGALWRKIKWINQELKMYCGTSPMLHYTDKVNDLLIKNDTINETYMSDALHPNLEGYKIWAPSIRHEVDSIVPLYVEK